MELWLDSNEIIIGYKNGKSTTQLEETEVINKMDSVQFDSDPNSALGQIKDGATFRELTIGDPTYSDNLNVLKNTLVDEINAIRLNKLDEGFSLGVHTIRADNYSQTRLQMMYVRLGDGDLTFPQQWRTKENVYFSITNETLFRSLVTAFNTFIKNVYEDSWTAKDSINSATT
ncbi:unnamed protein product, partial [marine sediment metagenome]